MASLNSQKTVVLVAMLSCGLSAQTAWSAPSGRNDSPFVVAQGYAIPQQYPPQQQPYAQAPQQPYGQIPPPPQFQGRVQDGAYAPPPQQPPAFLPPQQYAPPQQYSTPGGYLQPGGMPAAGYPPQTGVNPGYPMQGQAMGGGYPPMQGQAMGGGYPPPNGMLQGRAATVAAGTKFEASLKNTLDSGSTQPGEPVEATLGSPIFSGGVEVVPAGSKLTGQVTNVQSAKRFRFGANGKIEIKFTQVETPDGRHFPLSASIDENDMRLTGGTTAGRVGKGLLTTGIGAGGGAALGTGLGAIVGATSRGQVGRATGMGAVFGTAIGGGVGLVGAGVRKGSEVKITAGTALPVKLDDNLQVTAGYQPPVQQPYGGGYPQMQQSTGGGYYPPQ